MVVLQFVADGCFLAFAGGLGSGSLGFLLAVTAGGCVLGGFGVLVLDGFLVYAVDVGVRRSYAGAHVGGPSAFWDGEFVALFVDDAGSRLVLGLEFHFALELLDLLFVEEVAVLVAVLNPLLLAENLGPRGRRLF